jgi:protocatechuate 3,4-dioxygenase beta subunit
VLTGTVFDDHGQPMPGVPVMAWEVRTSLGGERTLDFPITGGESVTSDDRGIYRVYGLPPGEYTVGTAWFYSGSAMDTRVPTDAEIRAAFLAVTQPASAQRDVTTAARPPEANYNYTRVFMPDSIDPMTAVTVQLGAAEERDALDVHMQFRAVSKIEGTVVGPDGPANRARMEAWTRGRVEALNTGTVWSSGEDGRFTSRSLGPGEYTLRAEVPARGGKPAMFASTDITITTGDPVSVTLRLEPAMTLTGRILLEATTATPPADLSRARVGLFPTANGGAANSGTSVVDPSGAFTITGITPGRFRVTATLPNTAASGPPAWTLRSVTSGGRDLTDLPIDIAPGDAPSLTVTFTDQLAELSGTLTDAGGQPAADYFVIALPADRRYWLLQSRRIVSARPDVRGHFMFRALPPGDYLIAATTDLVQRDLSDPTALSELAAQSTAVRIAAGEQKVFDLKIGK